jgi:hypothetical protein
MLKIREILHLSKGCDPVQFEKWAVQDSNTTDISTGKGPASLAWIEL